MIMEPGSLRSAGGAEVLEAMRSWKSLALLSLQRAVNVNAGALRSLSEALSSR